MNKLMKIIIYLFLYTTVAGVMFAVHDEPGQTDCRLRYNQAGYRPDLPKQVVVMAGKDLNGVSWRIIDPADKIAVSGTLGANRCGITGHTPMPFNYSIDFSQLKKKGSYRLYLDKKAGTDPVTLVIDETPYRFIIPDAIRYLRVHRSGTPDTLFHKASHLGDARAILHRPKDGKWKSGLWEKVPGAKPVDMKGGWYDAADYIKFTLTTAYTCYFLLKAYEVNPALFTKTHSKSELPDILDEAVFGLDYLVKAFPSRDIFIIQVSGRKDHESGWRLPENDTREGKREAFSAISPPHMGLSAAALALGARLLNKLDSPKWRKLANSYKRKAIAMFDRAREKDALESGAFEFNPNGGFTFYRDKSLEDNMTLGAVELYRLTSDKKYLDIAKSYGRPGGKDVYWASLFLLANTELGQYDKQSKQAALKEAALYINNAKSNIWGVPGRYTWGSLANWCAIGAGMGLLKHRLRTENESEDIHRVMAHVTDYTFGVNNWGLSFFFTQKLPHAVQNIYSQIFRINKIFPEGALSEGPAGRPVHDRNLGFFKFKPEEQWTCRFNTEKVVFYDDASNFVTQESTIFGQASVILFLSLL